ncbi:MAG TPA: pitrilysin family protein [Thermoanaerobaculia bacterium]|nr:pitrilysin family protein [Thermoanaerobaculia bacterium]
MRNRFIQAAITAVILASGVSLNAQDLAAFEKKVTTRKLANGLTVLIVERPEAPVFSFFTHVDAGSAQEVPGITGLAHMFEHMAFKGTPVIGTKDYATEKKALEKVERAYMAYDAARRSEVGRDDKRTAEMEKAWKDSIAEADKGVVLNEFGEIIDRSGGVGLNAFTSSDETGYFYSLPSNRVELWAYLESERFLQPVMREFYKERDVVMEERRMRTDSNPIGKLVEQFLGAAYIAHPYGYAVVGWPSDLTSFSASDADKFFKTYYVPSNMVVTLVGDVKASTAMPIIEKYFGRLPSRPKPEPLRTTEPPQGSEKLVTLTDKSQPFYIEGYHKPSATHPDDAIYDVIGDLMSSGRTSRLYRALVRDKKVAAASAGFSGFPGQKYPNLFAFFAVPSPGHTVDEVRNAIRAEIDRLRNEDVTDDELRMVKTRAKADLIRGLDSNQGLARQLGTAQARFGDWRELFRQVDKIDKVSKADVRRIANATFTADNRTVGVIQSTQMAKTKGSE